jgi:hypothetical protein
MTIDESFDELYRQLRGSRCANSMLEARSLYENGQIGESISAIKKIQQSYENSRKATLAAELDNIHPADRDAHQLKKRQEKTVGAIELMNELLALLAIRERRVQAQATISKSERTAIQGTSFPLQPIDVDQALKAKLSVPNSESATKAILEEHYLLTPVPDSHTFAANERFVVLSDGRAHVVVLDDPPLVDDAIRMKNWVEGTRLLPVPMDKFHRSAARGRILRLLDKPAVTVASEPETERIVSDTAERDRILDMGAFTQLLDAAQRSGIVPGSGVIIQVRDCEYRLGKYNKALQMMESLYTSFIASETQRAQRLQREEADIASGRKKMSPRELQAKRAMDNQNNQAIERAKVRFQRVLEGIRGLLPMETPESDAASP